MQFRGVSVGNDLHPSISFRCLGPIKGTNLVVLFWPLSDVSGECRTKRNRREIVYMKNDVVYVHHE